MARLHYGLTVLCTVVGCHMSEAKELWKHRDVVAGTLLTLPAGLTVTVDEEARRLLALDSTTGTERWTAQLPFVTAASVSLARSPDAQEIYAAGDGFVVALEASNGKLRWSSALMTPYGFGDKLHGLVVMEDWIVVTSAYSRLVAIERTSGKPLWRSSEEGGSVSPLIAVRDQVIVTWSYADVAAHDGKTGALLWRHALASPLGAEMVALRAALLGDGVILANLVLALEPGGLVALDLTSGAVRWQVGLARPIGLLARTGAILIGDGATLRGLDPATGKVRWEVKAPHLRTLAPVEPDSVLALHSDKITWIEAKDGRQKATRDVALGDDVELKAVGVGGRVAVRCGAEARAVWVQGKALRIGDVGDHPAGLAALARKYADRELRSAGFADSILVTATKSGVVTSFRIE